MYRHISEDLAKIMERCSEDVKMPDKAEQERLNDTSEGTLHKNY